MSALTSRGSTRRWRRIRLLVLNRDGWSCRFIVGPGDARCGRWANHVHHTDPRKTADPAAVDDPAELAAACATHNLGHGATPGLVAAAKTTRRTSRRTEWSW